MCNLKLSYLKLKRVKLVRKKKSRQKLTVDIPNIIIYRLIDEWQR